MGTLIECVTNVWDLLIVLGFVLLAVGVILLIVGVILLIMRTVTHKKDLIALLMMFVIGPTLQLIGLIPITCNSVSDILWTAFAWLSVVYFLDGIIFLIVRAVAHKKKLPAVLMTFVVAPAFLLMSAFNDVWDLLILLCFLSLVAGPILFIARTVAHKKDFIALLMMFVIGPLLQLIVAIPQYHSVSDFFAFAFGRLCVIYFMEGGIFLITRAVAYKKKLPFPAVFTAFVVAFDKALENMTPILMTPSLMWWFIFVSACAIFVIACVLLCFPRFQRYKRAALFMLFVLVPALFFADYILYIENDRNISQRLAEIIENNREELERIHELREWLEQRGYK